MLPTVSVIIPCFNRAHKVGRAIDSVLNQTMGDFEILVVDDASTDDFEAALARFANDPRVRSVVHEFNRGPSAARNTGIAAARGRFIAFLDSDDLWLPTKLARQTEVALAHEDPEKVFCVTRTRVVLDRDRHITRPLQGPRPGSSFAQFLCQEGGFAQASAFFLSRELAIRTRFHEDMRLLEDHLFFIEAGARGGEYVLVEEVLTVWFNQPASDRASASRDLAHWYQAIRLFKEHAAPLVPGRVLLAAEVRYLSGRLWAVAPSNSIALLARALIMRALTPRQIAFLVARNLLPSRLYDNARDRLGRLSASKAA